MTMTLNDTIIKMISSDYKERFEAEYLQLDIRIKKLQSIVDMFHNNELDFKPTCGIELLENQLDAMKSYRLILEKRMNIEGISI